MCLAAGLGIGCTPSALQRRAPPTDYNRVARSRSALPITDTELNAIAIPATIGLSNRPSDA